MPPRAKSSAEVVETSARVTKLSQYEANRRRVSRTARAIARRDRPDPWRRVRQPIEQRNRDRSTIPERLGELYEPGRMVGSFDDFGGEARRGNAASALCERSWTVGDALSEHDGCSRGGICPKDRPPRSDGAATTSIWWQCDGVTGSDGVHALDVRVSTRMAAREFQPSISLHHRQSNRDGSMQGGPFCSALHGFDCR